MALITYNQNASMNVSGITPLAGSGISLLATPDFQALGVPIGDYFAETYQIDPSTSATTVDLGKITTGKVAWIQTDQPLNVTFVQSSYYGASTSDALPATTSIIRGVITIDINNDGARTLILGVDTSGVAIALDIQTQIRNLIALTPSNQSAYNNFNAVYSSGLYTLTSGTTGVGSSVVVTGASDAALLKLGVANGGTETAGSNTGPMAGTSVSGASPSTNLGGTITLNLNGLGSQTITLGLDLTGLAVAADIQAQVRALFPLNPVYSNFTASYVNGLYVLESGIGGAGSSVVVSGGTAAVTLLLGVANGGTESAGQAATILTLDSFMMANLTFTSLQLANMSPTNTANIAVLVLGNRNLASGSGIF